jgi:hypothetical protein
MKMRTIEARDVALWPTHDIVLLTNLSVSQISLLTLRCRHREIALAILSLRQDVETYNAVYANLPELDLSLDFTEAVKYLEDNGE